MRHDHLSPAGGMRAAHMRPVRRHTGGVGRTGRGPELRGDYLGAPTGLPSGETAYQVPPTPWPLVSPGLASPEKV